MPQRFFPELEADPDFVTQKATSISARWVFDGRPPNPEERAFLERVGLVKCRQKGESPNALEHPNG
jgi:hypothetical protein